MMAEFRMPDVGEGLTEAVILTWRVAVGDQIAINDVLLEIETAKSIVELPSPYAGTVSALLVEEGQTVDVGTAIVQIAEEVSAEPAAAEGPEGGVLVGYGPRNQQTRRRRRGSEQAEPPSFPESSEPSESRPLVTHPPVLAKPPVRRLAKELGVDLAEVPHESERVTREDVEAWARKTTHGPPATPPATAHVSSEQARREPVSAVRKATAEAMVASAFTAPHASEWVTVDVSESVALIDQMRADRAFAQTPVSMLVLTAKAVCLALRRHESMHAQWAETEIVYPAHVGLGIAAATERGLLVPVVADADTLSTPELASSIHELVTTAREGRLQPPQMHGGTFTITNVGVFGVDGGTPILPPGQTGILALGAVARRPWVDRDTDQIVARWVTTLAISFDHRVADGEEASRFLSDVARLLENPGWAVTF